MKSHGQPSQEDPGPKGKDRLRLCGGMTMGGGVPGAQSRAAGAWTREEVVMLVQHERQEGGLGGEPQRGWVACPEKEIRTF